MSQPDPQKPATETQPNATPQAQQTQQTPQAQTVVANTNNKLEKIESAEKRFKS